jgi:hypothetical protein
MATRTLEVPVGPAPARHGWSITKAGCAAVLAAAALSGVAAAGWYPRGPATGAQVALSMSSALLIGGAAGWILRSRWAGTNSPPAAGSRSAIKRVYIFEHTGHNADAEEPARYNDLMINTVLAETYHPA